MPKSPPKSGRPALGPAKRVRLSMTLKPALVAQLEKQAVREGVSASRLVERLVESGLQAQAGSAQLWEARLGLKADRVSAFAKALGLKRLALFGSVLTDRFRSDSDVDLLVEFKPGIVRSLMDKGRIQMDLQDFFGRRVDLVELRLVDNPIRRREIARTQVEVYAA
jgi:predicted nucleotidyltransferase